MAPGYAILNGVGMGEVFGGAVDAAVEFPDEDGVPVARAGKRNGEGRIPNSKLLNRSSRGDETPSDLKADGAPKESFKVSLVTSTATRSLRTAHIPANAVSRVRIDGFHAASVEGTPCPVKPASARPGSSMVNSSFHLRPERGSVTPLRLNIAAGTLHITLSTAQPAPSAVPIAPRMAHTALSTLKIALSTVNIVLSTLQIALSTVKSALRTVHTALSMAHIALCRPRHAPDRQEASICRA
jgi:hypothetical protein